MMKFKVEIKGFEKGKRKTIDKGKRVLQKSMFKMEELAVDNAPFDKGFLRANIRTTPKTLSNKYVLTSGAPYSTDLEYGNTPRDVKFVDIEKWVERKGIATGQGVYAFTNYVVKKIRSEGVNAHPFMRPARDQVNAFWTPIFMKEEFGQ